MGLPASGKTTWAIKHMAKNPGRYKRINKDDLRSMLDCGKWSSDNEKLIVKVRDALILQSLEAGKHVIVDDTNLHHKHIDQIRQLTKNIAIVETKDFTNVSVKECIERDLKREPSVGKKVILDMYNQFLKLKPQVIEKDPNLPEAIICDIDGTLALFEGNPYERDFMSDKVNIPIASILVVWKNLNTKIIIVSGRNNKFKDQTVEWLEKNSINYDLIFMPRNPEDTKKDFILKQEIYEKEIKGKYNVLFVLDDRNRVVELWRSLGLTCLQVADGAF